MMKQMEMGTLDEENKIGMMGYDDIDHDDVSVSSDVSSVVSSDDDESDDDEFEQSNNLCSSDNNRGLGNMSDLLQQLPSKKGLSKHFEGKSQSFTSLSKVLCLEDLAKPDYNKKIKSCKSYMGLSTLLPPPTRSASSSKLFRSSSRASCSSLSNNNRPPTHPSHHSNRATTTSGFSNQTPLFV